MSEPSAAPPSSFQRPARRPSGRARARKAPPHVQHVHEHLRRLEEGLVAVPDPRKIYLGSSDEHQLREVVGFRMLGNPRLVLAALTFRRLHLPGEEYARESLGTYLSSPPGPSPTDPGSGSRGEVSAILPRWHEAIPTFLGRLRTGPPYAPVHFRPSQVQVAFDFRLKNPWALETERVRAGPLVPHLFRTTAGHILRGRSHGAGSGRGGDFIAVTGCEQLTPAGTVRLPALMIHRDFVAMSVPLADERTRLAAPNWTPFLPETGTKRHILAG